MSVWLALTRNLTAMVFGRAPKMRTRVPRSAPAQGKPDLDASKTPAPPDRPRSEPALDGTGLKAGLNAGRPAVPTSLRHPPRP